MPGLGPRYPNQQLRAVSLETFFRGRFSVLSSMQAVQDEFSLDFPHLFVPNVVAGNPLDLLPYHLKPADNSEALLLALNQASYVSYNYPGHTAFMQRALKVLSRTLALLGVAELERVAYHYENQVGMQRNADNTLPLASVLRTEHLLGPADGNVVTIKNEWMATWSKGVNAVRISVDEAEIGNPVLSLRLASFRVPGGTVEKLPVLGAEAHDEAVRCFEELITEDFRAYISTKPIED